MRFHNGAEIHLIQLVTGKNEDIIRFSVHDVTDTLPHGIGGALEPTLAAGSLLRSQDAHEAAVELVEHIRALHVLMQRDAIELRQYVNAAETTVDAIADGNIHEAVLAGQRHGRFAPITRQGLQPLAFATAQNDRHHIHPCTSSSVGPTGQLFAG